MKIMIVDDSTIVRTVIKRYLAITKDEIVAYAANGVEAIERFKEHLPDLVTLDITMPEMNGLEALERMLEIKPDASILMISALSSKDTVVKAINMGAAGYLVKPVEAHQLIDKIKAIKEAANEGSGFKRIFRWRRQLL
ncbi:MAG: response regulator [Leptospirales bacterium]